MRAHGAAMILELSAAERYSLERHFLVLEPEDRRLRFGAPLGDDSVRAYSRRINFGTDAVLGVWDDELRLVAAAHVARLDGQAELGVSVLPGHRNQGLGGALLERAALRARNWGVRALYMHCLKENGAMMRLALKRSMRIVTERGEADAWLQLPPADAASYFGEAFSANVALFDHALKRQRLQLVTVSAALRSRPPAA